MIGGYGAKAQKISFKQNTVTTATTLWKSPVTATFVFTNKEKAPLVVKNVDAGCGCLSATWTEEPVAKGAQGEIKVTYDAMMLGRFDRIIDVYTNASDKPVQVRMKGAVGMELEIDVDELFPYAVDNVRLSTNNIEFPDVHGGDSAKVSIDVYNSGPGAYTPQLMHLPSYITMEARPQVLSRGRKGTIELTVHGNLVPDLGMNQTSIYVARFPGDKVGTNNDIAVTAVKLSDAQPVANGKLTPKMKLSTTDLVLNSRGAFANAVGKIGINSSTLGKVGIKTKLQGTVTISNKGMATLNITNLQAFNPAITLSVPKTSIEPGESIKMKIMLDSRYLGMSKAQPRILIITDDPKMPKAVINIRFE